MSDGQTTHTVRRFDAELSAMSRQILVFGRLVTQQLEDAVNALLARDAGLASEVLEREAEVNRMDSQIEDMAVNLVALVINKVLAAWVSNAAHKVSAS